MDTIEVLTGARALLANPANWTKGAYARDINGGDVDIRQGECFCAVGAICSVMGVEHPADIEGGQESCAAYTLFERAARRISGSVVASVVNINDEMTHEEVICAFDWAIEKAKEQS